MKKIKLGQIGIGHNHGEGKMLAAQKLSDLFEIVGYAESDENWIKERASHDCYKNIKRFDNVDELISQCDAILVECDVWNLVETAKKCVYAGKHVHIDKPAGGNFNDFCELLDKAKKEHLTVQTGYMYRYNFAINKMMEMIKQGALGEIYQIDAEMSTYHSSEYRQWLNHFKGGSMYIFGCHLIDLVVSLLGEPKEVHSFIKQTGFNGVYSDDNCFAVLEYDKAIARITNLSVEVNGWGMRRFAVMGSLGTIEIKPIELNVNMTVATADMNKSAYVDYNEEIDVPDVPQGERYDEMLKDFYSSIIGDSYNESIFEHEKAVQRTLLKAVGDFEQYCC